ncbi:MAG: DUF4149 domain-containing protein [Pseudomonadota bacterium]
MKTFVPILERILSTLWIGGLWVVGFVVAPTLFRTLPDTSLAGTVVGSLFTSMNRIGLLCGSALLILAWLQRASAERRWQLLIIGLMLVLIIAGEFVLAPMIAELRVSGQVATERFARLHGLAGALYGINCLLGLGLVATRRELHSRSG